MTIRKSKRKLFICIASLLLLANCPAIAKSLCGKSEKNVISFQVEGSGKTVSVCRQRSNEYLVYKFGGIKSIELQYPTNLDKSSWHNFELVAYSRGGGVQNDAMGDYTLKFTNLNAEYIVFQNWRVVSNDYRIGVIINTRDRHVFLKGKVKSQLGALTLLDEVSALKN